MVIVLSEVLLVTILPSLPDTATWCGVCPTWTLATTLSVRASITATSAEARFGTKM